MTYIVTALTPEVGVEVVGLHGPDLGRSEAGDLGRQALAEHGVVLFRGAHAEDADLVAFSRMLGEVVVPRVGGTEGFPEVSPISLDPAESALAAYQAGAFYWHIDGLTDDRPQKATLLSAREVPSEGGDTQFANTYAAWAALSAEDQAQLEGVRVVHNFTTAQMLVHPRPSAEQRAQWARIPEREHPLVWTHRDGRRSLLVGATASHVVGWAADESRALLDRLLQWVTQPRFVLTHHWSRGDLVVWDNTGMLHRALPYTAASRRLLHRTTLVGEEEVGA